MDRRGFLGSGAVVGPLLLGAGPAAAARPPGPGGAPAAPRAGKGGGPAVRRFRAAPRLALLSGASPLERCDRLRAAIPGAPHLYVKRDDQLGYLAGGNKLRKLEFVLADALERKATTVLTVGGIQSNHARITAMAARRLGLRCVLVMNGRVPDEPRANFRVVRLLGAEVHAVAAREERQPTMEAIAADLEKKGERCYPVPLGASNEVGALGFVAAFEEAAGQLRRMGVKPTAIVFSSSSGGTQAGLEAGKRLFRTPGVRLVGVSPDDRTDDVRESVLRAMTPLCARLGMPGPPAAQEIEVDDRYFGEGYRIPTPLSKEAADLFARTEGILLDPVYSAKAAAALVDHCRKGAFRPDDHVVFWHTGGLLALFE